MARGDRLGVERRFLGGLVAYRHLGIDLGDGTVVHARPDDVARRASALVGRDGYCPVVDNCEHLATWCATGRHRSRQVEAALAIAAAAVVWVGGAAARTALGSGRSASA